MHVAEAKNRAQLHDLGVEDPLHQLVLIDALPCGIETPREAVADDTAIQINAPRALMVVEWKGKLSALREVERRRAAKGGAA